MITIETLLGRMKDGRLDPRELEQLSGTGGNPVTISGATACYGMTSPYLQVYCTVTAIDGNAITSVGLAIFGINGVLLATQSNDGFSTETTNAYTGTSLYSPWMGDQITMVISGNTERNLGYILPQVLTITDC